jgi:hypothetical protein
MIQAEPPQQAPPPPVPDEQTTSPWAGRAARARSFWNGGVTFAHDVGEWAKLVTLVLAIAGLLGFLFPGVKRCWEIHTGPESWYYIGRVERGTFHQFAYQHPLWNDGPVVASALSGVPGSVIVTMNEELHIGRAVAGGSGAVRSVSKGGVCLYVRHIEQHPSPDGKLLYVWAGAVRVSC